MPFDEALAQASAGELRDAKTIIGLFEVDALARAGEVPGAQGQLIVAVRKTAAPGLRHVVRDC